MKSGLSGEMLKQILFSLIKDDNAIIIDLEGGTTRGWVDRAIGGTVEGDSGHGAVTRLHF
jgi:hypothetical protein